MKLKNVGGNFMKRMYKVILVVASLAIFAGCSKVPAGHVGIKVNMLGGSKGVDFKEVGPGRYFIGPNTELYRFPTFTQNYVWTKESTEGSPNNEEVTFQTIEGMSIQADVGISYHINPAMVGNIFVKYRKGVDEITDLYLRNMVRDAFVEVASKMPIEAAYGTQKTEMVDNVEQLVSSQCAPIGIEIEKIYLIGDLRLPPTVIAALNQKIEATQRAQQRENEVREAEAQAQKDIAQATGRAQSILVEAQAQAEANQILNKSLTTTLVEYKKVEKWNGQLPSYVGGSMPIPLLNTK